MSQPNLKEISALQHVDVREGVVLRPLVAADAEAILAILEADPTIRERVSVAARLYTADDFKDLIEEEKSDKHMLRYVLCEHNTVVGMVNVWKAGRYFESKASVSDYGFGYFLGPSARGRGLVTSSLVRLMDIVIEHLPVRKFIAFCEPNNIESGAVLQRAGFEKTDVMWKEPRHGWVEQKYAKTV